MRSPFFFRPNGDPVVKPATVAEKYVRDTPRRSRADKDRGSSGLDLRVDWVDNDSRKLLTTPHPRSSTMSDPNHETPVIPEGTPKGKQRAADRLNIPSSVVRASGFAPGDKVFVADEDPAGAAPKPCLVLLKEQPPKVLADYAVAKGCRIRVTVPTLKKCGLEGANFKIDGSSGKIIVRPQ